MNTQHQTKSVVLTARQMYAGTMRLTGMRIDDMPAEEADDLIALNFAVEVSRAPMAQPYADRQAVAAVQANVPTNGPEYNRRDMKRNGRR